MKRLDESASSKQAQKEREAHVEAMNFLWKTKIP